MAKPLESVANSLTPDSTQIAVLREDLNTLAKDAKDFKDDAVQIGAAQARKASAAAREQLQSAKDQASESFDKTTAFVRENPGQSVAIAFLAGALISLVFGSRR